MFILILFAFISGLVTIFAPCIWPILPIILSSTATGGKRKPLGITLGIITSFAVFTLSLSYILRLISFDPDILRIFAVFVIGFLGLSLLIPKLSEALEGFVSRLSSKFAPISGKTDNGFLSGLVTGFSLGIVWSPCAGPILATIATLAATQKVNLQVILVTISYVVGIGIPLFIFTKGGSYLFTKSKILSPYTGKIQQVFGIIMIISAVAIATGYDRVLEVKLLNIVPSYSNFLYKLEGQSSVTSKLEELRGGKPMPTPGTPFSTTEQVGSQGSVLPNYGAAPELTGIVNFLNTNGKGVTLEQFRGKVVLVDFWTYTCINCIRTLPFVTSWYEKYNNPSVCPGTLRSSAMPSDLKDKCFVVIGVHTPEFEFEKKAENVQNAIKQYNINYPVVQDNNYSTWNAYNNHYWPAEYLIDTKGNVRRAHFGEGEYDKTEEAIQSLLKEAGLDGDMNLTNISDQTPRNQLSPETYLGLSKMERFSSSQTPQQGVQTYTLSTNLPLNYFALGGNWDLEDEYAQSKSGSSLEFNFLANKVFLVITPKTGADMVKISLDGKPYGEITATDSKLYTLIDLKGNVQTHILHLDFQNEGTKVFAFTFGD